MTEAIIYAILPSLFVGVVLAVFNRRQKIRDEAHAEEIKAKRKESELSLKLLFAVAKLSYAVAMAYKRGQPNGEVEEGIEAYEDAKRAYTNFLNEQANNYLIH